MARHLLVLLVALLAPRLAFAAGEADKARATGLFAEAQALADAGKHAEACPKFEESVKAHAGVGNRFHLADCWEKTGRLASAHALFLEVASVTRELGQTDREQAAIARAEALAPKLTRLRIEVTAPNDGVELTRDGVVVPKADWGRPIPIDAGVHELRAAAAGKEPWTTKLDTPKEPGTLIVNVPVLTDEKKKPIAAAAVPVATKKPAKQAPPPAEESSDGFRSAATLGLVGLGTAGIVTGVAMSIQYTGNQQDAESICPESVGCTPEQVAKHQELVDDAKTARTWAFVGYGVGAASLVSAAILHFTAPSKKDRPSTAASIRASVFASPEGTLGGALRGEF